MSDAKVRMERALFGLTVVQEMHQNPLGEDSLLFEQLRAMNSREGMGEAFLSLLEAVRILLVENTSRHGVASDELIALARQDVLAYLHAEDPSGN